MLAAPDLVNLVEVSRALQALGWRKVTLTLLDARASQCGWSTGSLCRREGAAILPGGLWESSEGHVESRIGGVCCRADAMLRAPGADSAGAAFAPLTAVPARWLV